MTPGMPVVSLLSSCAFVNLVAAVSSSVSYSRTHHWVVSLHQHFIDVWTCHAAAELASLFNLTDSLALNFPSSPVASNEAFTYITSTSNWLVSAQAFDNPQNLAFVADPFPSSAPDNQNPNASPSNASATVMSVTYPEGSYTLNTGAGGAQFNNFFNETASGGTTYQSMLLTYEVAFGSNFQFVKGSCVCACGFAGSNERLTRVSYLKAGSCLD